MPRRPVEEITVSALNKAVDQIVKGKASPRLIRVGGVSGLGLNVRLRSYASGEAISASWVLRRTHKGQRRDFALGAWPDVGMGQARERARITLDQLWQGIEPAAQRSAKAEARTFRQAAERYFEDAVQGQINQRDEAKWFSDLKRFVYPIIGDAPVDQITRAQIERIVEQPHVRYGATKAEPFRRATPEGARRCIKKIETILRDEPCYEDRPGTNPALRKGRLATLLTDRSKKGKDNQPSLPYAQLPDFLKAMRERGTTPTARALEFLILTCARSGEVREATWSEVDIKAGVWTIPAERMKASKDHRVPLSYSAMAVLMATPHYAGTDLIFPGKKIDRPMSDNTLRKLVQTMDAADREAGGAGWVDPRLERTATVHGFRSTFRDWAADKGVERDIAELALAHKVGSDVERAYRRTDMVERRRAVMEDWAGHALGSVVGGLRAVD